MTPRTETGTPGPAQLDLFPHRFWQTVAELEWPAHALEACLRYLLATRSRAEAHELLQAFGVVAAALEEVVAAVVDDRVTLTLSDAIHHTIGLGHAAWGAACADPATVLLLACEGKARDFRACFPRADHYDERDRLSYTPRVVQLRERYERARRVLRHDDVDGWVRDISWALRCFELGNLDGFLAAAERTDRCACAISDRAVAHVQALTGWGGVTGGVIEVGRAQLRELANDVAYYRPGEPLERFIDPPFDRLIARAIDRSTVSPTKEGTD